MTTRRVYHQVPRDDFVAHPDLGLATIRTDHPGGAVSFEVLFAPAGFHGLHLDTGTTVTRTTGPFVTIDAAGTPVGVHSSLRAALASYSTSRTPATPTAVAA